MLCRDVLSDPTEQLVGAAARLADLFSDRKIPWSSVEASVFCWDLSISELKGNREWGPKPSVDHSAPFCQSQSNFRPLSLDVVLSLSLEIAHCNMISLDLSIKASLVSVAEEIRADLE
jgi:hypothetical protein